MLQSIVFNKSSLKKLNVESALGKEPALIVYRTKAGGREVGLLKLLLFVCPSSRIGFV